MIRFCDSNVGCAEYGLLNRSELLSYFLSGNREEIVCVYDGSEAEEFVGIITYYSLLYALSMESAIIKDYVILDRDVWRNAREYFRKKRGGGANVRDNFPLPVLDQDYHLICFAYQDMDADREIRMLRELKETQGALQFSDVFPEYKCVKIHGFNELAYFFADYLIGQNVQVQLEGTMWQGFFEHEECQLAEFECLNIYAEGTWEKTCNWKENLLRSVSVEFECVDKVYEANIKNGSISDVDCGGISGLIERLREKKEVILLGIDRRAQDAYDFLLGNGIEACCFVVEELNAESVHRIFGKKILGLNEAIHMYKDVVFIDCASEHGAWGLGRVDYYDYIGYRRNERYFVLKDYVEVPENNLLNTLSNTEVVLTGDQYLCGRLYEYLIQKKIAVSGYFDTMREGIQSEIMPKVSADNIGEEILCLIVEPVYRSEAKKELAGKEEKNQCIVWLREKNIDNFTDYFCDEISFINIEKDTKVKYKKECYKPKRIVLGSILPYSGNIFFRSLLDSHPSILSIYYCDLNNLLFWISVRLSMECAENILPLFWKMIEGNEESIIDRPAFTEKMKELLRYSSNYTSQELFVMFHIAYMYMFGRNVTEDNVSNMIIYWEPHYMDREKLEQCVKWLGETGVPCDIINLVRNSVSQKGSTMKELRCIRGGVKTAYFTAFRRLPIVRKECGNSLIIKFEDLKLNPVKILQEICERWDMEWADTLLQTTRNGQVDVYNDTMQRVSGFDLRPVYNLYEEFFSELDRLKLMIVDALWQKKFGYPYVEPEQFTRRELQEVLLQKFRFEQPGDTMGFYKDCLELDDRIRLQNELRCRVQETRCLLSMWENVEMV